MLVLVIALLSAQPVPAGAKPPVKPDEDQRVKCHVEDVTGSLVGHRRVCHTVAEWRTISDRTIEKTNEIQDRGLIQPTNGH